MITQTHTLFIYLYIILVSETVSLLIYLDLLQLMYTRLASKGRDMPACASQVPGLKILFQMFKTTTQNPSSHFILSKVLGLSQLIDDLDPLEL